MVDANRKWNKILDNEYFIRYIPTFLVVITEDIIKDPLAIYLFLKHLQH